MPYLANSVNSRVDTVLTEPPKPVVESSSTNFLDRTILQADGSNWRIYLAVILVAAAVYLASIVSPPSLMDDVDAVQAQIARNMITSGDWVTPRLDGVVYLEKPPLIYWLIAPAKKFSASMIGRRASPWRSLHSRSVGLPPRLAYGLLAGGRDSM